MVSEAELKTPLMEWYMGIALPGEGIRMVTLGTVFYNLHPELHEQMGNWGHTQYENGLPSTSQFHIDAGNFVESVTGFAPETIMEHKRELERLYLGQLMGPFPFPVEWIKRNFI